MHLFTSVAIFSLIAPVLVQAQYSLLTDYFASDFFGQFDFFDGADPTHGSVLYQGRDDSLISSSSNNAQMHVSTEQSTPNGRPSIRLTSKESYQSGLIVVDVAHMPGGICGTWPAFWTVGPNWPNGGEIDIIEGVNAGSTNQMTLHTGSSCSISSSNMLGTISADNCDVTSDDNTGCPIVTDDTTSYGSGFNANGGGVYATQFNTDGVVIWFWPRSSVPDDALGDSPTPSSWSTPLANFTGSCDFATSFAAQNIVFDTTFCGDWAGDAWSSSSCASKAATCQDYVENNGADFEEAYWSINGLKVYQSGSTTSTSNSTTAAAALPAASSGVGSTSSSATPLPSTSPATLTTGTLSSSQSSGAAFLATQSSSAISTPTTSSTAAVVSVNSISTSPPTAPPTTFTTAVFSTSQSPSTAFQSTQSLSAVSTPTTVSTTAVPSANPASSDSSGTTATPPAGQFGPPGTGPPGGRGFSRFTRSKRRQADR